MNTSTNPSPLASANDIVVDALLEDAAMLMLGALSREEVRRIHRELLQASAPVQHEYNTMVLTTQLLPAALPMVEPPPMLKQRILSCLHDVPLDVQYADTTAPKPHHDDHKEFIPHYDARGASFYALSGDEGDWLPHPIKGIAVKPLATDKERGYATILMRLDAGTIFPSHSHAGAEQCYIISGTVVVQGRHLATGSFFSTQAHTDHGDITTTDGATVLLVVAMEDYRKSVWRVGLKMGVKAVKQRFTRLFA